MGFRQWFEQLTTSPRNPDAARRPDLIKGGLSTDRKDMPMGMRTSSPTSAFPTYSLKKIKRQRS